MSKEQFLKDFECYFTEFDLSDFNRKRLADMFDRHSNGIVKVKRETHIKTVEKIVNVPVYIDRTHTVYIDSVSNKKIHAQRGYVEAMTGMEDIIDLVCNLWGVEKDKVKGKGRERRHTYPRFFLFHFFRETGMTLKEIGRKFNKDHTSIMHGIKQSHILLECGIQPYCTLWFNFNKNPE